MKNREPVIISTRKIERNKLRREGKLAGAKPTKYLRSAFDRKQRAKYGSIVRDINIVKGTHPKKNFRTRIETMVQKEA